MRVIVTHLQKKAAHSWCTCDFDFTGSHIEEPSFDNSIFLGKTTWFGGATFIGKETWFRGVDFGVGVVSFERPRVWSSAPTFDWDPGNGGTPKPANVMPEEWPPVEEGRV